MLMRNPHDSLSRSCRESGKQHCEHAVLSGIVAVYPVREVAMSQVLVVNEISTEREEIQRALEAEGFTVVLASSPAEAVREIWGGSFLVAIISTLLTGTSANALQQQ